MGKNGVDLKAIEQGVRSHLKKFTVLNGAISSEPDGLQSFLDLAVRVETPLALAQGHIAELQPPCCDSGHHDYTIELIDKKDHVESDCEVDKKTCEAHQPASYSPSTEAFHRPMAPYLQN